MEAFLMIRQLPITPAETAAIRAMHYEITRQTVSTEPTDHAVAEAAVAHAYQRLRRAPVPIIWADSPREALRLLDSSAPPSLKFLTGDPMGFSLEKSLGTADDERWMRADIKSHTDESVRKALLDLLPVSLWAKVDQLVSNLLFHEFRFETPWHYPTQLDRESTTPA